MVETLTLKQIYDEIANQPILDIKVPVERDGKDLVVTPEILAMFKPDSTGRLHPIINTLGKQEVTEDDAAAILTILGSQPIMKNLLVSMVGTFNGGLNTETEAWRAQHKYIAVPLQMTGAGTLAAVPIVAAVADYRSCLRVWGIWSDKTDATVVLDLATTTGFTTGPAAWDVALLAGQVTQYGQGVLWEGSTVNEAIDISTAAGQGQADQKLLLLGDWWHEVVP
ncbi:MAG: hypothetical protein KAY32_18230 [Candidatus Eisenbacteria sp.]|nr:hypothetical protein [Candidatus Eisenbacteria bacterium]